MQSFDTDETPRQGFHRRKRDVDRVWINYQLQRADMTVQQFGARLARELKRSKPFDKASASRRLTGRIPFTAREVEALSRIFDVPVEEVIERVGSGAQQASPAVGTIAPDGAINVNLDADKRDKTYSLTVATQDGWQGATVVVKTAATPPTSATRGLYVVANGTGAHLRQCLGVHGGTVLLSHPLDASAPVESIPAASISSMQKVTRIRF